MRRLLCRAREIRELVLDSWEHYHRFVNRKGYEVVNPSLPILYFGDKNRYDESEIRIITVGLNPSHMEFPKQDRFQRFREGKCLHTLTKWTDQQVDTYLSVLNRYFVDEPYERWFKSLEPILNGLNCSFYPKPFRNTALHTDFCTVLATVTTWSKLSDIKGPLQTEGKRLWHRLVEYLKPDLMLISVARPHLDDIRFKSIGGWREIIRFTEDKTGNPRNPYVVYQNEYRISPNKNTQAIFGRAANVPFGLISRNQKRELGRKLLCARAQSG